MKKLTLTIITVLFCLTSNVGWSADFQKGLTAAQSGDFVTALREWTPLAEQGNAPAQHHLGFMYHKGKGVLLSGNKSLTHVNTVSPYSLHPSHNKTLGIRASLDSGHLELLSRLQTSHYFSEMKNNHLGIKENVMFLRYED